MQLGLVGLGRMGGNMRERLRAAGHEVVGFDHNAADQRRRRPSPTWSRSSQSPRAVWVMVPAGGHRGHHRRARRAARRGRHHHRRRQLAVQRRRARAPSGSTEQGIGYLDVGVSGGVWGQQNGYALMVGGAEEHVDRLMPIFEALKPEGEFGFVHAGPVGAGHYAKMVHNGIEYGLMHAYAEGYELLERLRAGDQRARA